jgi:hypothetical protein
MIPVRFTSESRSRKIDIYYIIDPFSLGQAAHVYQSVYYFRESGRACPRELVDVLK